MSLSFWKRLSTIGGLMVLAGLFGLMIFVANLEIKDLDLWLHIGMGKYIVHHAFHIPRVDILSCTIAGNPWINHEWLFQVIVYEIFHRWGPQGIITLQVVLITITTLLLLLLGYNNKKQLSSVFVLLLVTLVYQGRFTNRPDLFSLLFFAVYIFIMAFYIGQRWSLYALLVIQALWVNIHGFFFFGPLFVMIGLSAEWLKRHAPLPYEWNKIGRLTDEEYRRLKMILGAVILACLLNPYTLKGAWYPISIFFQLSGKSRVFFENIVELQKPMVWGNILDAGQYPYYKLLILLSALSFFFNRRKIDIAGLIFWLIFLVFSLSAVRNMIFFAFAAYLVFVTNALTISMKDIVPLRVVDKKFVHIISIVVKGFLFFWIVHYGMGMSTNGYFDVDTYEWKSEFGGVSQKTYPYKAVDFLVENKIGGNFFNGFNTGAYLVGRCFPRIKVFIDGRTEVYGPDFFQYYRGLWEQPDAQNVNRALDRYKITGVLLHSYNHPVPEKLLRIIDERKDFVPVYLDFDGVIYLKDIPANRPVIDKYRLDFAHWEPFPMDLLSLGSKKVIPIRNVNRAYTLEALGHDEAALQELDVAQQVSPTYYEPYKLKGKIFADRREFLKAFENFRIATILSPHDRRTRLNLALSYYDLKAYDYAAEQYQKVIARWPNSPESYFKLARVYVKMEEFDKAVNVLGEGLKLDPRALGDALTIGDMLVEAGAHEQARAVFSRVAEHKKDGQAHYKLGRLYRALNKDDLAREEFNKALHLEPDNRQIIRALEEINDQ